MPAGDRVGSAVVICPISRNGSAGMSPELMWRHPLAEVVDGAGQVHGARGGAGGSRQGTGPLSAQSTLTVPGSHWKDRICRRTRSGSWSQPTSRPYSAGADTSAMTARVA